LACIIRAAVSTDPPKVKNTTKQRISKVMRATKPYKKLKFGM
jgi:hypothetical protein